MFKFIRRLITWLTLISLIFWAGVAWHIVNVQPKSDPPAGYPANVAECRVRWAQPITYTEVREEAYRQCDRYYALMGDRTAPYMARLREQVLTRLTSLIILEYMEKNPPQPGETVTGQDVVATLGTKRIAQLLVHVVTHASDPYMIADKAEARCRIEEVRRVQSVYDLAMLETKCQRQR